ncbi:MAG: hypothetical protein QNK89_10855 [Lacinutrix sp.]|uniref:hypothetical protein n=1 Tax=Lacinutrix sp. TaxID=1937692 RepID=UPI0030ACD9F7
MALEGKKKSKAFLDRKAFDKKHRKEVFDIGAYYELEIPEKFKDTDLTIQDYLFKDRGYWLYYQEYDGNQFIIKGCKSNVPLVIGLSIDGVNASSLFSSLPLNLALNIEMHYIEYIMFQPIGSYLDKIVFFTKDDYKKGITNNFKTYVFKEDFSKSKKYYVPLFSINSNTYNQEIDWKPNLISNTNGEFVFKLKDEFLDKGLLFSIQGFTNQGNLISRFYKLKNSKLE